MQHIAMSLEGWDRRSVKSKEVKMKFTAKPLLRCMLLAHDIHK